MDISKEMQKEVQEFEDAITANEPVIKTEGTSGNGVTVPENGEPTKFEPDSNAELQPVTFELSSEDKGNDEQFEPDNSFEPAEEDKSFEPVEEESNDDNFEPADEDGSVNEELKPVTFNVKAEDTSNGTKPLTNGVEGKENKEDIEEMSNEMTMKREALMAAGIKPEKLTGMNEEQLDKLLVILDVQVGSNFDKRQLRIIEKYGKYAEEIKKHVTPDMELAEIVFIANLIENGRNPEKFKGVHDIDTMKFIDTLSDDVIKGVRDIICKGSYNLSVLSYAYNASKGIFSDILPFISEFESTTAVMLFTQVHSLSEGDSVIDIYNKWGTNIYDLMLAIDKLTAVTSNVYYPVPREGGYELTSIE